ncbi:immunity 8 family protein [bacterium]|nr:immunity 8 family protein [bacterium]
MFVCTPKWLLKQYKKDDLVWGRHMLIAFEYNLQRIRKKIEDYCSRCTGDEWMEIAAKIAMVGQWEFGEYNEHESQSH